MDLSLAATLLQLVVGSYLFSISDLNLDLTGGMYWLGITNMVMEGTLTTFAVPLPAAMWLLASGLLGLAGMQNLSKRQRSQ